MKIVRNILIEGLHQKPIVTDLFFQENNQPKPIVLFCHGYKGFKDWGAWNLVASAFAAKHFFFVKFNFSHNGATAENPTDFPDLEAFGNNNYTIELDDLESVIQWILNHDLHQNEMDKTNIYLIGHSRAGGIVTIKSSENKYISKVVSWAGVADFANRFPKKDALKQWKKEGVFYVANTRTQQKMPHYFQYYQNFKQHENRLTIKTAIEKLSIPYLIIHGTADESVSVNEAHQLYAWNPKSILHLIENTNHTFNISHPYTDHQLSNAMLEVVEKTCLFLSNKKEDLSPL